jgi:hypothetical protein
MTSDTYITERTEVKCSATQDTRGHRVYDETEVEVITQTMLDRGIPIVTHEKLTDSPESSQKMGIPGPILMQTRKRERTRSAAE